MTRDEAVSAIAGAIQELDDDDVEFVASVIFQAIERVNVRMVQVGKTAGSGWRQGVVAEIFKKF